MAECCRGHSPHDIQLGLLPGIDLRHVVVEDNLVNCHAKNLGRHIDTDRGTKKGNCSPVLGVIRVRVDLGAKPASCFWYASPQVSECMTGPG